MFGHDTPYYPESPSLSQGGLWIATGQPMSQALSTHAMLIRLRAALYSPAYARVPAVALWWRRYGIRCVVCWN
jgi:hypothetical protein